MKLTKELKKDIIDNRRRSGKTLSSVLMCIARAMQAPNVPLHLIDYEPYSDLPRRIVTKRALIPLCRTIISKLELKYFKLDVNNGTITYDLKKLQKDFIKNWK